MPGSVKSFQNSFLALTILCCAAFSSTAQAEDLSSAIEAALNRHPSVEAALANRDALGQDEMEQFAGFFPRLNLRAQGGRTHANNSVSRGINVERGTGTSYLWEGSVTLTQPIFDGFETYNRFAAAYARRISANFSIVDIRERLALRTVVSFLDVARGRETVGEIRQYRDKISDYVSRINTMVTEGAADATMVVQAMDIKAQLDSTLTDLKAQMENAMADYAELVGHLPDGDIQKPVPELDLIPLDERLAVSETLRTHPLLRSAAYTEEAFERDIKAEKGTLMPDLSGELSYLEKDLDDIIGGEVTDAKALLRLNWDISLAGAEGARVKKAKFRKAENEAQAMDQARQIEKEVRRSFSDFHRAHEQFSIAQERMKFTHDLFTTTQSQFEGGAVNLLQLLQADNGFFNAKLTQINAEYAALLSHYTLLASMGQLQRTLGVTPENYPDDYRVENVSRHSISQGTGKDLDHDNQENDTGEQDESASL